MKCINFLRWAGAVILILLLTCEGKTQDRLRPFLNAGYVTSFKPCSDCERADAGGSVRIGILTKRRFGFYAGYVWFQEYHKDYIDYDDKGSLLLAGINFRILRKGVLHLYINGGIGIEEFTSTYTTGTETETSVKSDIGLLLNIKHFNAYMGWQPSEPSHFNIGFGFTI